MYKHVPLQVRTNEFPLKNLYTMKWWKHVAKKNYDKKFDYRVRSSKKRTSHLPHIYHFRKLGRPVTILFLPLNARCSEIRRMPYRGKKDPWGSRWVAESRLGSIKWRRHSTLNTLSKCWFFQRFIICCNSSLKLHLAEVGRRPSRGTPLIFGSPCSPTWTNHHEWTSGQEGRGKQYPPTSD